jgi:hypothetical protein
MSSVSVTGDARYGGTVTASYEITDKVKGSEVVELVVTAYQNANGAPNTDAGGPDIVYAWIYANLDRSGQVLVGLPGSGTSSTWSLNGGGAAVARVELVLYGKHHTVLATTGDFPVAA